MIFNADLDNTMIYSYRHDIGNEKICVEIYQNRQLSFITKRTYELLSLVKDNILFVPTTTRTVEQYNRIDLGIGTPKYALVCNGGVLLVNGKENDEWYKETLDLKADSNSELIRAKEILKSDDNRCFEVRFIKELFIFTKSERPQNTVNKLKEKLDLSLVNVFHNGMKVYVIPHKLSKGVAIRRLKEKLNVEISVAAGDSEFDVSMLKAADVAMAPISLKEMFTSEDKIKYMREDKVLSESILEEVLAFID